MIIFKQMKKYIKEEYYNLKYNHSLKLLTIILLIILYPITIPLVLFGFFIGMIIALLPEKKEYDKSVYKLITKKNYIDIIFDKGYSAEYYIWKILNGQPEYKKVLINLYLPKEDGNTCEVDAILINKYGIFVIESKGYSGWIFGSDNNKMWLQTIYKYKNKFYSPVLQNRNHIKILAKILDIDDMNIFKSYIVFSNRCEIKKMNIKKENLRVIKREQLNETLKNDYNNFKEVLNNEQIKDIEDKLFKYMFCDDLIKAEHIEYVEKSKKIL